MPEFSASERVRFVAFAAAPPVAWYIYAPDYSKLLNTPIGGLTVSEMIVPIAWLIGVIPIGYWTISMLYQAVTGRDHVRLWHRG